MTAPLDLVPDLPRWVTARALLLGGAPAEPAGDGAVIATEDLAIVLGAAPADAVLPRIGRRTALVAIERTDLAAALADAGFAVARATVHTLPDPTALPDDDGASPLPPAADLGHLPAVLAAELRAAAGPVIAAWVDGQPVSFARATARTERWVEVAVDTLRSARQLGLATRTAAALIRAERAAGREPVWNAFDDDVAARRLAARLGFEPTDALWVATPR